MFMHQATVGIVSGWGERGEASDEKGTHVSLRILVRSRQDDRQVEATQLEVIV